MQDFISAIDIGTTKVCALTASVTHDSLGNIALDLIAEGRAPSQGIRRGVVVDVPEVANAVATAVEQCEAAAGQPLYSAFVGIAGSHIGGLESQGACAVDRSYGVDNIDIQRALESARAVVLAPHQEVIHTLPRTWTVDDQSEINQPLGMSASRLEVAAHIVTGSSTAVNNLVQCIVTHGVEVDQLVLEPLASSKAVLRPEERRMGVAVVDMGGGTTDIAVYIDDILVTTEILDVGGNHLTHDVAVGLHAPFETAEELKIRYGHVMPSRVAVDETVWATVFGEKAERSFSRRFISKVLQARAEEICDLVCEKLEEKELYDKLPAGIVLTGGASQLPGLVDMAKQIFGMPVRVGKPGENLPITGLSRELQLPTNATGVGLLLWGLHEGSQLDAPVHSIHSREPLLANGESWMGQAAHWLKNLLPG
ncbi:MAG: cell division protein FtsA [Chloroflexota bacterium]